MMNKKYLMNGFAALALVAGFSSCVKDVDGVSQAEQEASAKENAELQLGLNIPDGQTWNMASQVEANVTVNGDYGANYTVTIYENNPFIDNTGVVLGKAKVASGGTATISYTCPNSADYIYAVVKDEKGYNYMKSLKVEGEEIEATFNFPGNNVASSRRVSMRSSSADDFVIETLSQPDFSNYINGATPITTENNTTSTSVRHYVIPAGTTWSDNIPLISASDPNSNDIVSVYVLGTWNIPKEQRINGGYGGAYKLIVGNGGVINLPKGVTLMSQTNQNASTVGEIHVLAGGKIEGKGKLEFSNGTNTYCYNAGTINVGTINNNGGKLYNKGILKADKMEGGGGGSLYINAGKVHIKECPKGSSSANNRIHNNCWFECDGDMSLRNLVQGAGAYFKIGGNFEMSGSNDGTGGDTYIYLKENSLLEVIGASAFNNTDIVGPTGENYAYIQFGYLEGSYEEHNLTTQMSYTGWPDITIGAVSNNIYVSIDHPKTYGGCSKFVNEMMNGTSEEHIVGNSNAQVVQKGQVNGLVKESDCTPGVTTVPPTPIYETLKVYTYAFEDQTVGTDYDMNDVVLKVNYKVTDTNGDGEVVYDKTKLAVKLVAAGATYNIKVKIGNTYLFDGKEIHEALGASAGQMVNTGNGKAVTKNPISDEIDIPSGWNGDFTTLPVTIEVESTGKTYSYPNDDAYPHAIMVPTDWRWPLERIIVTEAYPGTEDAATVTIGGVEYPENSFAAWGGTPAAQRTATMNGWFNYPNTGKTMTNASTTATTE